MAKSPTRRNAGFQASRTKGKAVERRAGRKASATKGKAEESRAGKMAHWTREHGKNDALNPYSRENWPG